jgi:DNA-binding MltR family transcriptional regulator
MSKGRRKPNLRDYSHLALDSQEQQALTAAVASTDQHAIVTAVLGYVAVEHELDVLLRQKFKRRDDDTWEMLLDERGPLRTFAAKITIGYAFGIYNEKIQHDLNIVRVIRNAFAHSKKLLDFDDPLVLQELMKAHLFPTTLKKEFQKWHAAVLVKAGYIAICLQLVTKLMRIERRALSAKSRRFRKKYPQVSNYASALLAYATPSHPLSGLSGLGTTPESSLLSSQRGQSASPNPLALPVSHRGAVPKPSKSDDSEGK